MAKPVKKHSFHYDSDDGLLDEIGKLTAPPGTRLVKPDKEGGIISQKNWKSVNTQYCIVCREGGELLCCDTCPASFHLMCHQPVIYRDEIPDGRWMCNRCFNTPAEMIQSVEQIDQTETEEERNRRAALRVIESSTETDPLSILAQAALAVNAQQFELPDDCDSISLPYDYVKGPKKDMFGKRCRMCHKVVDDAPLTQCDFCDGMYHLDCVQPPLCSQPKGKWMCPNHTEHVIDHKMLKSNSIIQRRDLWNQYARQPIDDIGVTRNFVQKAGQLKGTKRGVRQGKVHSAIKEAYRKRFDLGDERVEFATETERKAWLDMVVKMHSESGGREKKDEDVEVEVKYVLDSVLDRLADVDRESTSSFEKEDVKPEKDVIDKIGKEPSYDLLDECIEKLRLTTDAGERTILCLAIERLEQLGRKAVVNREQRALRAPDSAFNRRMFLLDQPITAVMKAEGSLPIAIQRCVTTIGTSTNCHLLLGEDLNRFCPVQGPNHAALVFDRIGRRFELIPTGCHQVLVDGQLYGASEISPRCICQSDRRAVAQAAPLRHGSSISIGCSRFVFATFF